MALKLYMHPLASFCWKAIIAFYENDTPFEPHIVDLGNEASRAAFQKIWPLCKFPVLRDDSRDQTVPESTIIIEYLAQYYPGKSRLIPESPDLAIQTRLQDRFFDLHVHVHMQNIVGDRLRPADKKDPTGVQSARSMLQQAYGMLEQRMANKTWAMGDQFTMADCAASPALYYGHLVEPLTNYPHTFAYLERLQARPSFARVIEEAQPYFQYFPRQ